MLACVAYKKNKSSKIILFLIINYLTKGTTSFEDHGQITTVSNAAYENINNLSTNINPAYGEIKERETRQNVTYEEIKL